MEPAAAPLNPAELPGRPAGDTVDQQVPIVTAADRQAAGLDVVLSFSTLARSTAVATLPLPAVRGDLPKAGRHARPPVSPLEPVLPPRLHAIIIAHIRRLFSFSLIGLVVLVAGILAQWATVRPFGSNGSYAIQAVFSIELSYLLNRRFTWRDRASHDSLVKWNLQRLVFTAPNWLGFALLVHLGAPWLVANLSVTAVFVVVNYVVGDTWSFRRSVAAGIAAHDRALPATWMPTVSVVIPCKNNQQTIGETVSAFLAQDYPYLSEVIVVGDVGDLTWRGLAHISDPRLVMLEHTVRAGLRDPNVKRDKGLNKARGEVLALADSDIVMDRDWLTKAIELLREQGSGLVAGGMRSIHDTFWGRFVDGNVLAAKTPRLARPYLVTAQTFGKRGCKPPISANAVFMRDLYLQTPLDARWFFGYEDYEWFWRVVKSGHKVLFSGDLTAAHHHRRSFRKLVQEYSRSANGCAEFVRRHGDSPLARKRLAQALLLPVAGAMALAAAAYSVVRGDALAVVSVAGGVYTALALREVLRTRRLEAVAYPFIGAALGMTFTFSLARGLVSPPPPAHLEVADEEPRPLAVPLQQSQLRSFWLAALAAVLGAGMALRLWQLSSKPEWNVDEVTYTSLGSHLLRTGYLNLPIPLTEPWTPFLWHPPFYFLLLARWFALVGPSVYHARLLGVICCIVMFALLAALLRRSYGPGLALWVTALMVFDGWLLYAQRSSYIENVDTVLIVGALVAYQRARRWPGYLAAGLLTGAAVIFNHDASYTVVALVLHWLMVRRDHGLRALTVGAALAVLGAYIWVMSMLFDVPGHPWYAQQTLTQIERVLALRKSQGTLSSPFKALHLLAAQYWVFAPSALVALASVALLFLTLARCVRARSLAPLGSDLLIPAWAFAGVIVFGSSELRYTQYFSLALIPLYCFLWTRVGPWLKGRRSLAIVATAAVIVAGLASFYDRVIVASGSNAFEQVEVYAEHSIPRSAIVMAESSTAYEIPQRWCNPYQVPQISLRCQQKTTYLITWQTYLQSDNPYHSAILARMIADSTPVATFHAWNGTMTVRKVNR